MILSVRLKASIVNITVNAVTRIVEFIEYGKKLPLECLKGGDGGAYSSQAAGSPFRDIILEVAF